MTAAIKTAFSLQSQMNGVNASVSYAVKTKKKSLMGVSLTLVGY